MDHVWEDYIRGGFNMKARLEKHLTTTETPNTQDTSYLTLEEYVAR